MNGTRPQLFGMLAGLFLAAGLVFSSMLATATWLKVRNSQFVTVKGSTRKNVTSDLIVWQGSFQVQASALLDAEHQIQANRANVRNFLAGAGVTNAVFQPIVIEQVLADVSDNANGEHIQQQRTVGYRLTQRVRVESEDVDRLAKLDPTPLVADGVLFTADPPQFLYTRAAEEKIEMLADATKDARARAEQIARQGGRVIASLHDAEMGVFQITPLHATDTSSEGESDITSQDKTITAVVTATFVLK
ncbi:MAG TPA: SIMPL domain-containing protein [Candidatus Sulfotelmatobacter sp.]|nr:SIMPL domain-containing protein [Candidatus Sulfotelmatobacter sp.]